MAMLLMSSIALIVSIAVTVSIPVAVSVAVFGVFHIEVIDDDAEDVNAEVDEAFDGPLDDAAFVLVDPDDEHHAVHEASDDRGIGDGKGRRGIDQDLVVFIVGPVQELFELGAGKKFGGIAGTRSAGNEIEIGDTDILQVSSRKLPDVPRRRKQRRKTGLVAELEEVGRSGATHVGIDQERPLPCLCIGGREVGGTSRFSVAGFATGDDDPSGIPFTEGEGGAQSPEGFRLDARGFDVNHESRRTVSGDGLHFPDHREDGDADFLLEFFRRTEAIVEGIHDVDDADAETESEEDGGEADGTELGPDRFQGELRIAGDRGPDIPVFLVEIDFLDGVIIRPQFASLVFDLALQIRNHGDLFVTFEGFLLGPFEVFLESLFVFEREIVGLLGHLEEHRPHFGALNSLNFLTDLRSPSEEEFAGLVDFRTESPDFGMLFAVGHPESLFDFRFGLVDFVLNAGCRVSIRSIDTQTLFEDFSPHAVGHGDGELRQVLPVLDGPFDGNQFGLGFDPLFSFLPKVIVERLCPLLDDVQAVFRIGGLQDSRLVTGGHQLEIEDFQLFLGGPFFPQQDHEDPFPGLLLIFLHVGDVGREDGIDDRDGRMWAARLITDADDRCLTGILDGDLRRELFEPLGLRDICEIQTVFLGKPADGVAENLFADDEFEIGRHLIALSHRDPMHRLRGGLGLGDVELPFGLVALFGRGVIECPKPSAENQTQGNDPLAKHDEPQKSRNAHKCVGLRRIRRVLLRVGHVGLYRRASTIR